MADMFFGAYLGEFSDKFGINWMVSFQENVQPTFHRMEPAESRR